MRRLLTAVAVVVAGLTAPAQAGAAYPSYPANPPTPTCSTTYATLATFQTALNTSASTATPCLAAGTYAGLLTVNRTTAGVITGAGAGTAYGATITGGVALNSGNVNLRGLNIQNAFNATNLGDCVRKAAGVTATTTVSYSRIHNCYRNGVTMARPAACSPAPCAPPATGYAADLMLNHDWVYDVGNTDTTGSLVILRGASSSVTNSDLSDTPNDFINVWGAGNSIQQVKCHDNGIPALASHPDCVQSWNFPTDDGAEGLPPDNLTVERVRAYNITGPDAHFLMLSGNVATVTIRWNELNNVGNTGDHSIILGATTSPFGTVTTAGVKNNVFYDTGRVEFNNSSTGTIYNNIFRACNDTGGPWIAGGSSVAKTNNTGDGNAGCTATGTNPANRDPMFVAPGSDFHLKAGSPEHDAGAGTTGGTDIDNQATPIGTVNRGADEE